MTSLLKGRKTQTNNEPVQILVANDIIYFWKALGVRNEKNN